MAEREREPAAIQREIEQTRVELAETIDAIAEKVSPKRVAARTTDRIKSRLNGGGHGFDVRSRLRVGVPETGEHVELVATNEVSPTSRLAAGSGGPHLGSSAIDKHEVYAAQTGVAGGSSHLYEIRRKLRVDRVLMAAGGVAVVVTVVVLVRRHRG